MELTRHQVFIAVLHDKEGRILKLIARNEALDLTVQAATEFAPRKDGQYTAVYAQVGVSK